MNGNQCHQQNTDNEDRRNGPENELGIGEQFTAHFRDKDRIAEFADGFLSAERVKQIEGEGQFPFDKDLLFGINIALLYFSILGRTFDIPVEYAERNDSNHAGKEQIKVVGIQHHSRSGTIREGNRHAGTVLFRIQQECQGIKGADGTDTLPEKTQGGEQIRQQCVGEPCCSGKEDEINVSQEDGGTCPFAN